MFLDDYGLATALLAICFIGCVIISVMQSIQIRRLEEYIRLVNDRLADHVVRPRDDEERWRQHCSQAFIAINKQMQKHFNDIHLMAKVQRGMLEREHAVLQERVEQPLDLSSYRAAEGAEQVEMFPNEEG